MLTIAHSKTCSKYTISPSSTLGKDESRHAKLFQEKDN